MHGHLHLDKTKNQGPRVQLYAPWVKLYYSCSTRLAGLQY